MRLPHSVTSACNERCFERERGHNLGKTQTTYYPDEETVEQVSWEGGSQDVILYDSRDDANETSRRDTKGQANKFTTRGETGVRGELPGHDVFA